MKRNSRSLKKAIRSLEREKKQLERNQKKLISDIKKSAKQGQMGPVKIMAKDLVRSKRFIQKMIEMRSHLWGVQQRMNEMKSTHAMTDAMKGASRAMVRMNKQMNMPQIQKIMREFAMESEKIVSPRVLECEKIVDPRVVECEEIDGHQFGVDGLLSIASSVSLLRVSKSMVACAKFINSVFVSVLKLNT